MKKIILGIGVPGSGKTTVLKQFSERYGQSHGYVYISPDEIREELYGNAPFDPKRNPEVWSVAYERVKNSLADSRTVVFDSTFAARRQRKEFIQFCRAHGAEKIEGIMLDVPLEIAKERNKERAQKGEKQVPDVVIEGMYDSLLKSEPSIFDGLDAIFRLGERGELAEVRFARGEKILKREFIARNI